MKKLDTEKPKVCRPGGFSITPEQAEFIEKRIEEYSPVVQGLTHYLRILVQYDQEHNIMEKMGLRPFAGGAIAKKAA